MSKYLLIWYREIFKYTNQTQISNINILLLYFAIITSVRKVQEPSFVNLTPQKSS